MSEFLLSPFGKHCRSGAQPECGPRPPFNGHRRNLDASAYRTVKPRADKSRGQSRKTGL